MASQTQHPPGSDSRSMSTPRKRDDGNDSNNRNKAIRIPRDPQGVPQQRRRAQPATTMPKYPAGYFFG
jgi:hypothetical protein